MAVKKTTAPAPIPATGSAVPANTNGALFLKNIVTAPYDPKLTTPQSMPMEQIYPAFAPGALDQLSSQMMAGFGTPQQQSGETPNPFTSYLSNLFQDTRTVNLKEPILQTYASLAGIPEAIDGKSKKKKDGTIETIGAKNPFQQYGYSTGSDYLDKLFGIQRNLPNPPDPTTTPTTPTTPVDPTKPPKTPKPPKGGAGGGVSPTPISSPNPQIDNYRSPYNTYTGMNGGSSGGK